MNKDLQTTKYVSYIIRFSWSVLIAVRHESNDLTIQLRIVKEENVSLKAVSSSLEQESKKLKTEIEVCSIP